ncbi:hypothetical protein MMC13_004749 [Lambiella insularis]|nr:hypothetical protein [Lambiella insularis]
MVDIDAPDPSNPIYAQYIHWLQPGITFAFQPPGPYPGMTNNSAPVIPYRRPTPPNYSQAHRYVFLLYNQPDDFAVPADFPFNATSRANFNDTSFAEEMGLGAPLMANWYSCSNYTGAAPPNSTTTAGASTGTAAATKTSNGTALATATPSVSASRTASGGSAIATGSAALANTVQSVAFSVGLVVVVAMMM